MKAEFESYIDMAKAALNSNSQIVVNNATGELADKIEEFINARQPGTGDPVNKTGLSAKITEAELEKLFVVVASSPEEVAQGRKFVTKSVMDALETSVTQAKNTLTSFDQNMVNTTTNSLNMDITAFRYKQNDGTKSSGFTQADLDDLLKSAKTIKDKIKTSNKNGDDVGPAEYWVSDYSAFNGAYNNAITAASNQTGNIDNVYNLLVSAINTLNTSKQFGSTADKNSLFDVIRYADTVKTGVMEAANAAEAPSGFKWATRTQWSPFNEAYTNALDAARAPNATKNSVTSITSSLNSATITFNSSVNSNGPGTKLSTIVINGLPYDYNGSQIDVYLFENPNFKIGEQQGYGSGTIRNNATGEIRLSPRSGITSINGSWYVVLVINKEPKQYYISKSEVTFTTASNVVTSITDYKKYVFKERFGDITAKNGVPSSVRTLDDLFQYVEDITYSQMLEWKLLPAKLYKNEALTQPFSGSEALTANTYIYCEFSLMDSLGTISNKYIIPLSLNTWKNGSINKSYGIDMYSINVTSGRTYYLWWNDYREGDESKDLDIDVYAYKNGNNPIPLENNDDAWFEPVSFTANSSGKVYIRVRAYDGGQFTGTYAIMYNTSGTKP